MTAATDRRRDGGGAAFAVGGAGDPHAGPGATGGGAKELHIGSSRTPIPLLRGRISVWSGAVIPESWSTIGEVIEGLRRAGWF